MPLTSRRKLIVDCSSWPRGGSPAIVKETRSSKDAGVLRIDFPGYSGEETLEHITWDEFFDKFDTEDLDFLCQEETAGDKMSRFCKFVTHED